MHKYVFGPIPSRRLGQSLGVSPIPEKTCNYSCVYCQLGRTNDMHWQVKNYFPVQDILDEVKETLQEGVSYDVLSVVGEGEPALYADLKALLVGLKKLQKKPVCVITNAANIDDPRVADALLEADILMPSLDGVDETAWRTLHRPSPHIHFDKMMEALFDFRARYRGHFWLEVMLVRGVNDSKDQIDALAEAVRRLHPDRVFVNTPVRPPAESWVEVSSPETIAYAAKVLDATPIDALTEGTFSSAEEDPVEAIAEICLRHPMNQFEILHFLEGRGVSDAAPVFAALDARDGMVRVEYKGIATYRNREKRPQGAKA